MDSLTITQALQFLATALLLLVSVAYLRRRASKQRYNLPPGPKPWPVIGNLNLIGSLPHQSIHHLSQTYGPLMHLRFGSFSVAVASSVDMAKTFLKTHDLTFAGRPKFAAGRYTTYNYSDITWSGYGPYWRQARRMCLMELFSAKRLESYEYIRKEEMKALLHNLHSSSNTEVIIKDHLSTLSLNVISRMVLGKKYTDESENAIVSPDEFKKMLDELFLLSGVLNIGDSIPWLDFLDLSVQDLIAGGTESSAVTVEWALSELLKQPNLPYIQAIVKETMRLHPVAPMLVPREAREDCQIDGYDIPKGTRILVNVWTIGRDPQVWDNPNHFYPDRFIGKSIDVKGHDFELLPFGSGRRMCPGYTLGLKVIESSLANLLHGFNWKMPGNRSPADLNMEEVFGLSTPKKFPLSVVPVPRLSPHLYG